MKKNYKHNDKNVAKFKNINSYELKNITEIAKKGKIWKKITKNNEKAWNNISKVIWFNQVEKESESDESSNLKWTK